MSDPEMPDTPATSPSPGPENDKLARIKHLVEHSKLYAQFLMKNLRDKPEQLVAKDYLAHKLHPHQEVGLQWMLNLFQNGLNGILADEMGLGKTIQVIGFLAYLNSQNLPGPFLIVAPLSTLSNWLSEFKSWAPQLKTLQYYGSAKDRKTLRSKLANSDIIITSYEIVMSDAKFLARTEWKYVIVDEGHRLKNVNCKLMKVLKRFSSANRMLLTGTPLQNNLMELWSLLNFLMPSVFTDIEIFHTWFEQGNSFGEEEEHTIVNSLHSILRPFVLRRLKSEVNLPLPKKREYVIYCDLSPFQQELYGHLLKGDGKEYLRGVLYEQCGRKRRKLDGDIKHMETQLRGKSFSNIVMQLRQACNSPYMFFDPWSNGDKVDERIEESSGKLKLLYQFMKHLQGHKVLLFSQFTTMLDVIEDWARFRDISTCRIDGSTPQEVRQNLVDNFNQPDSEYRLFLLSTRAGGQGINLMGADTVIIFDSDWNPQQDLQAMDRVHRIGQENNVLVFRFITGETIEETLLAKAREKLELGNLVIEKAQLKGVDNVVQLENMDKQLQRHKVKYQQGVNVSEEDFKVILDRSAKSYDEPQEVKNPNISLL